MKSNKETEMVQEEPQKYDFDELVGAAESVFNTKPEVVYAALTHADVDSATKEEARTIIEEFLNREV